MSEPTVRPTRPQDAAGIRAVHIRGWQETYSAHLPADVLDRLPQTMPDALWPRAISDPEVTVVVGEHKGRVVGFACAVPRSPDDDAAPAPLELTALYVLRAFHGTGLGQRLTDAVLGESPAYLWVADGNPRAEAFYARNGFGRDGAPRDEDIHGHTISSVRMVREGKR